MKNLLIIFFSLINIKSMENEHSEHSDMQIILFYDPYKANMQLGTVITENLKIEFKKKEEKFKKYEIKGPVEKLINAFNASQTYALNIKLNERLNNLYYNNKKKFKEAMSFMREYLVTIRNINGKTDKGKMNVNLVIPFNSIFPPTIKNYNVTKESLLLELINYINFFGIDEYKKHGTGKYTNRILNEDRQELLHETNYTHEKISAENMLKIIDVEKELPEFYEDLILFLEQYFNTWDIK